ERAGHRMVMVSSGIRTPEEQARLRLTTPRAATSSTHVLTKTAADFSIEGLSKYQAADLAFRSGLFKRVSVYNDIIQIHVDMGPGRPGLWYNNWHTKIR